jgi:hypothetical protein
MLKDGLYELSYRAEATPGVGFDNLLVALRGGTVLGTDRWGGVLLGQYQFDPVTRLYRVSVCLKVPPGGTVVTEAGPREGGGYIDIEAAFDKDGDPISELVEVAGHPVRISLVFKGPVPR